MSRRLALPVTVALGVTAAAGVAIAAWTASGTGTGTATTLTAQGLLVTPGSAAADLFPGGPAGAVSFLVDNPNPYDVRITSAAFDTAVTGAAGCDGALFTTASTTSLTVVVPAGANDVSVVVPGAVSLAPSAPDACQGVSASFPVALTGTQIAAG